ncbi:hypothetical protein IWW36_004923 [Coemansia brasiliensis]|uniref:Uncharacterized protein n=1 Tax=Coemansia brasiliensis TaxID=2650707 RepID=A0A9W8LXK8_9FUNG|nr:hypothetical protein IWW36_004923 [Coemansia brasiliensis]
MAVVSAQQTAGLQPAAQMPFGTQGMGMFTPIRLIQPQTQEQRQAIDNLVQELQRISPQLFSTAGQSNNQQLAIALPSTGPQPAGPQQQAQPAQQTAPQQIAPAPQAIQFPQTQQTPQAQPVPQAQQAQQTPQAPQALQAQPAQQASQELPPQSQLTPQVEPAAPQAPLVQPTLQAQPPEAAPEPAPTPEQTEATPSLAVSPAATSDSAESDIPLSFALNALFQTASRGSTAEASSDSLPFGLHFDTISTELGSLELESSSGQESTSRHHWPSASSSHTRGSSTSASSALDEWAGLDSSAAKPAVSLVALGLSLLVIYGL